jgi:hypothetical protein
MAFATSYAASQLSKPRGKLRVEFDPFDSEVIAVLDMGDYESIIAWTRTRRATLLGLRPFWAQAFGDALNREETFSLIEPDAISIVSRKAESLSVLTCELADPAEAASARERMRTALGDDGDSPRGIQYMECPTPEHSWGPL